MFLDESAPDAKKIDEALRDLRALEGKDFGTNGNRDDLERVSGELDGLTAAETDALMSKASPKDLAFYDELLTDTGDSPWNPFDSNGLSEARRRNTLGLMLSRNSPENLPKSRPPFPACSRRSPTPAPTSRAATTRTG